MNTVRSLINGFIWDHIEYYVSLVDEGGEDTVIQGIRALDENEKFVHGALVNATAQLYIHYVRENDPRAAQTLERLKKFIGFIKPHPCRTWGKLSVLRALSSLKEAGLLDSLDAETLEMLKEKTDYTDFYDKEKMMLRGAASNYNQVAMSCAGYRELIGFENDGYCDAIKEKLLDLMKNGAIDGWMDEQPPYGRFDRYSLIVTSELSDSLDSLHKEFPDFAADNLRKMAKLCVFMANNKGDGVNYGRSLSCHGDDACVEAIASAFRRGLVDDEDKDTAIAYSVKIIEKTLNFWYDKEKRSFDIWWNGRSTNRYRQVHRVLEVNLDMSIHLLTTLKNFELAGVADYQPKADLYAPESWVSYEIPFINDTDRKSKTVVLRRNDTLVMLPLIGLGSLYNWSAYLPYPAICGVLEAAPESNMPYLVPEYVLSDGTVARPIQYYTDIVTESANGSVTVTAKGKLATVGERFPTMTSCTFTSVFTFSGDVITASFEAESDIKSATMIVGVHSENHSITVYGFDENEPMETSGVYDFMTPHGPIVKAAKYTKNANGKVGYTVKL
jgi:hypothetical protein